ncbi:nuclear transport factor 2 family protein [Actinomadura sp. ATCC 31491]|uniref:Nuclear transport factor 2 family protein n=1 Tax=Actinomadura luzonensis TaxID=2805427 RepID=A0ABT0FZ79_9ACTN|nr:nuclear transport factor 2 family protein [Actinomadura luzonensis]MCK2217656.1 nuclear transport factor 2 family protein [Actinomadura luzonensis]
MSKISHRRALLLAAVVPVLLVAGCAAGNDTQAMKGAASPSSPADMMSPDETGTDMESPTATDTDMGTSSPTGTAGNGQARSAVQGYFDALKSGNVNQVVGAFSDDAVVAMDGEATATGANAIRTLFQDQLKGSKDLSQATHTIEESRDLGGQYSVVRSRSKQGNSTYRELFLLAQEAGQWKITQFMNNKAS